MTDVPGWEGKYAATKSGRVWSYPKIVGKRLRAGLWLTPQLNSKGYFRVSIGGKWVLVHRVIARTFIPKVEGAEQVNHKSGIKTDNRVKNLEWCNASENHKHAYAIGMHRPRGADTKARKKYDMTKFYERKHKDHGQG
jgi:hypothetical protein